MRFVASREALLKPLQQVVSVVERRQTMPVLSNLLLRVVDGTVAMTATDLEVELVGQMQAEDATDGETTVPARKLFDIVRALPDGSRIDLRSSGDRITLASGRSRFTLMTLPAGDFPAFEDGEAWTRLKVSEQLLRSLIDRTAFAMAHQDVRYYLNGLLLETRPEGLRCVATDGHRMALADVKIEGLDVDAAQVIIPRKGVIELHRLLEGSDALVDLELGRSHVRVARGSFVLSSKLISGRFPDYQSVIPIGADKELVLERDAFRAALQRAAILSNEKYRGVKLDVSEGRLRISAQNPENEEAVEEIEAETRVAELSVGFNVTYLLDALGALSGERVRLSLRDANSSCLLRSEGDESSRHVVMPLRL